jgi:hypothetical protein
MTRHFPSDTIARASEGSLSEDVLRRTVPSIFATEAHESRSERYTYLPTIDVVRGILDAGFALVEARQSRSAADRRGHAKHMLRFRPGGGERQVARVGDTFAEAILINAHDGSCSYQVLAGLFKLICSNGMVADEGGGEAIRVRHTGDVIPEVVEGTRRVIERAELLLEKPRAWSRIGLTQGQRSAFAEAARIVRFGDENGNVDSPVSPSQLLAPRRPQDGGHDLWTTFNVVQENVIRGGITGLRSDPRARSRVRRFSTRPINGIDGDVKLNRALWTLAQKLSESV